MRDEYKLYTVWERKTCHTPMFEIYNVDKCIMTAVQMVREIFKETDFYNI